MERSSGGGRGKNRADFHFPLEIRQTPCVKKTNLVKKANLPKFVHSFIFSKPLIAH
jgi:hypothetical protein